MNDDLINQNINEPIRPNERITTGAFIEASTMCYALGDLEYYLLKNHKKSIWTSIETFRGIFFGLVLVVIGKLLAKGFGLELSLEEWEYYVVILSGILFAGCWLYNEFFHDSERKKIIKKIDVFFNDFNKHV